MKDVGKNNLSAIELGSHTGTHADAPFHFIAEGKTLDDLPLDTFVGPCRVAALLDVPRRYAGGAGNAAARTVNSCS